MIVEVITLCICEGAGREREGYREGRIGQSHVEFSKNTKTLKLITVQQIVYLSHVDFVHPIISLAF